MRQSWGVHRKSQERHINENKKLGRRKTIMLETLQVLMSRRTNNFTFSRKMNTGF